MRTMCVVLATAVLVVGGCAAMMSPTAPEAVKETAARNVQVAQTQKQMTGIGPHTAAEQVAAQDAVCTSTSMANVVGPPSTAPATDDLAKLLKAHADEVVAGTNAAAKSAAQANAAAAGSAGNSIAADLGTALANSQTQNAIAQGIAAGIQAGAQAGSNGAGLPGILVAVLGAVATGATVYGHQKRQQVKTLTAAAASDPAPSDPATASPSVAAVPAAGGTNG